MRKYAAIVSWTVVWAVLSPIVLLFVVSRVTYYLLSEQRLRLFDDLERQLISDVGAPLGYLLVILQPLWLPFMFLWIALKWFVQSILKARSK